MAVFAVVVSAGCDPAFDPIKETNRSYSVYGYLNASADTQFIRIEKLRDNMPIGTLDDLGADVQLTNVTTGQTTLLQDSLFNYRVGRAHNYFTTLQVNPEQQYRLEVQGNEGAASAEVDIPDTFPEPSLAPRKEFVQVQDIDRLIAVKTIYDTCQNCGGLGGCPDEPYIRRFTYSHLADTAHIQGSGIRANYNMAEDLSEVSNNYPRNAAFTIVRGSVVIAAGTANWPNFLELDAEAAALPNVASNIDGGVGLLGGIVTDTVTFEKNPPTACYTSSNKIK